MQKFKKENYTISPIERQLAIDIIIKKHYLHRRAPCSIAFGLFQNSNLVGVILYGTPASSPLRKGICGPEEAKNVIELTRLWVDDSVPKNAESFLISNTVSHAGKPIIVSFADPTAGHVGYVYQAANWIYTGLSAKRTNWTVEGLSQHSHTIADKFNSVEDIKKFYGSRFSLQPRPQKHRYIWFCRARRKELLTKLRYPILPYPKNYQLLPPEFQPGQPG